MLQLRMLLATKDPVIIKNLIIIHADAIYVCKTCQTI